MSLQYTLEIENFSQGQNLTINIRSVIFSQYRHLPAESVGATKETAKQVKEVVFSRGFDQNSHLFANQTGKSFPKVVLRIKNSDGKSYLYTFHNAYLESYMPSNSGGSEITVEIKCYFDEFTVQEVSPAGNTAKPVNKKKTADRHFQTVMNFVRG